MQSINCSPAGPAAPQIWGEKLLSNDLATTGSSSCTVLLGGRNAARKMAVVQPRATIAVEGEALRRKERRVVDGNGQVSNGATPRQGDGIKNLEVENPARMRTRTTTLDFLDMVSEFAEEDGGPPRWFCPVQKGLEAPAPLLLSLPGILGVGSGLFFHYGSLGRLFELRCLHIPNMDRTSFEGLVSLVEDTVREEAKKFPGRPIYLLGENVGGALALSVAARNTQLDLVLILVNPSTSFGASTVATLQPFLTAIQALPAGLFAAAPFLLGFLMGDPSRLSASKLATSLPGFESVQQASESLLGVIPATQKILNSLPKETILWKFQMLNSSAKYANSRLQDVKADVIVLASIQDRLLPSLQEARRINKILPNCTFRKFEQSSHSLFLEEDIDLASVIKKAGMYRQTPVKDDVANFLPPTEEEIAKLYDSQSLYRKIVSPVFFSTGADGRVMQGLANVPSKGPIVFVGNHSLLGLDMKAIASLVMKERQIILRGLAHPVMFKKEHVEERSDMFEGDLGRLFGAVPVSGKNFYKMLARGDNVALYPGGAREALHRRGETHKLIWPDQPEFVKMAARFGATIIPMCSVGEDDLFQLLMDYDDLTKSPLLKKLFLDSTKSFPQLRADMDGEVGKQALHMPLVAPNVTEFGRMYILFGKPIHLEGKREFFRDQKNVNATYQALKRDLEAGIAYLLRKREEDPYRRFLPRILYEASLREDVQAPTFKVEGDIL